MTTTLLRTALHLAALLALPPLLLGVVNRTKAIFAGRTGPPLVQPYLDLAKLLRKGAVYSRTTTWVFRAGPVVGLAAVAAAGLLLSMGGAPAALSFAGDFVLFAYLLGLARFFTALAALDTGSAFEGMGASREAAFSAALYFLGLKLHKDLNVPVGLINCSWGGTMAATSAFAGNWAKILCLLGMGYTKATMEENLLSRRNFTRTMLQSNR